MRHLILTAALLLGTPALADKPASATPKPAKGSPEEVVCRRTIDTGSLISARRTCLTRAQWTAQSEAAQSQGRAMDEAGRVTSCARQDGC